MPRNTTVPVCPHCDNIYDMYWVDAEENRVFGITEHTLKCDTCNKEFKCTVRIRRTFTTEKTGD